MQMRFTFSFTLYISTLLPWFLRLMVTGTCLRSFVELVSLPFLFSELWGLTLVLNSTDALSNLFRSLCLLKFGYDSLMDISKGD